MKKMCVCVCAVVSLLVFVSASVWEGAAAMSGDFSETGNFLATNSFPEKTVVDVTNLETGKMVRLIVSSGLDTPGFLALLSRDAAGELGIESRSPGRIRMTRADDLAALSRFTGEEIVDLPEPDDLPPVEAAAELAAPVPGEIPAQETPPQVTPPVQVTEAAPAVPETGSKLILNPAKERPPENAHTPEPDPADFVQGITQTPVPPPAAEQLSVTTPTHSVLSAREISIFEKGKYYLQLAAYSTDNVESVEYAISGIDHGLPTAVRKYYSDRLGKFVYRVLIGPLNLGESGALLEQYRGRYKDAFVWLGKGE